MLDPTNYVPNRQWPEYEPVKYSPPQAVSNSKIALLVLVLCIGLPLLYLVGALILGVDVLLWYAKHFFG